MVKIRYQRIRTKMPEQKLEMKSETYRDIIKEHGSLLAYLETMIHEPIEITEVELCVE